MQNGLIYDFQMERAVQQDWTKPEHPDPQFVQPALPKTTETPPDESPPPSYRDSVSPLVSPQALISVQAHRKPPETHRSAPPPVRTETPPQTDQTAQAPEAPQKDMPESLGAYHFLSQSSFAANPKPEALPPSAVPQKPQGKLCVLGEIFQNYILAECDEPEQLLIFDKHAAHERVIFEQLQSGASKQTSQMLLRPIETLLSMDEFSAVQDHLEQLDAMGFSFDCSTPPRLLTRAVPAFVLEMNMDEVIAEIAQNLMLGKADSQIYAFQDMLHTIACKSAIRASDHTSLQELQRLAQQVWEDEHVRHCSHGKPVMFVIRKSDMEKQFQRT